MAAENPSTGPGWRISRIRQDHTVARDRGPAEQDRLARRVDHQRSGWRSGGYADGAGHPAWKRKRSLGGCFCCRFSDLMDSAERLRAHEPDVILAEPVGSCIDISATVLQPIKRYYGDRYRLAPFTVLVDPQRAHELLAPAARILMSPTSSRTSLPRRIWSASVRPICTLNFRSCQARRPCASAPRRAREFRSGCGKCSPGPAPLGAACSKTSTTSNMRRPRLPWAG